MANHSSSVSVHWATSMKFRYASLKCQVEGGMDAAAMPFKMGAEKAACKPPSRPPRYAWGGKRGHKSRATQRFAGCRREMPPSSHHARKLSGIRPSGQRFQARASE